MGVETPIPPTAMDAAAVEVITSPQPAAVPDGAPPRRFSNRNAEKLTDPPCFILTG